MTFIDPSEIQPEEPESYDWPALVDDLNQLLRLRATPVGMKLYTSVEEMEAVPRIRRPDDILTTGQIVAQAVRLNWIVGVTNDDLPGAQCGGVLGLRPQDEQWQRGESYAGVWYETKDDAAAHQQALDVVPYGTYEAMAVSPLASGRLDPPDICLLYATPGQMIMFISGMQWAQYSKFEWGIVGESACADSWGRALSTGKPSLSIPCFAERRYGGVLDEEMLMAIPPKYLPKTIEGMKRLSRNGLRYPIPPYGIQTDARAGLGFSYG